MTNLLATIFWPALAVGLVAGVAWRFMPPGWGRTTLQIVASLFLFIPQLLILLFLYQAVELLLYQEALLSLWMIGVSAMVIRQLWRRWTERNAAPVRLNRLARWRATEGEVAFQAAFQNSMQEHQQTRSALILVMVVLLMGGFGLSLARTFALDAFAARIAVHGDVQNLHYNRGSRAPRLSSIMIDGRIFKATRDLHGRLQIGDRVDAEVGAGSHAILRFSKDPSWVSATRR